MLPKCWRLFFFRRAHSFPFLPLRLLRKLGRHPNIIEFCGVYRTKDKQYYAIVMELMPQGELLDVIGQIMQGHYTEKDVLVMFRQVVEAVDHCHRNSVVHCDIKVWFGITVCWSL